MKALRGHPNGKETTKMLTIYDLLTAKNSVLRSMLRLLVPAERARTEKPLWKERNEGNECWMLELGEAYRRLWSSFNSGGALSLACT